MSSFVVIGHTLHKLYYDDKLMKTQKEFLAWTKANLGFSKSTTYEYIISYKVYSSIAASLPTQYRPPAYQSHCQLLAKIPAKRLVDTWISVCLDAPNGIITTAYLENYLEKNNLLGGKKEKQTKFKEEGPLDSPSLGARASSNGGPGSMGGMVGAPVDHAITPNGLQSGRTSPLLLINQSNNTPPPVSPNSPSLHSLPINEPLVFELGKNAMTGKAYDTVVQSLSDYASAADVKWKGRLFCNMTMLRSVSTASLYGGDVAVNALKDYHGFEGGIENVLQLITRKFQNREFTEALFLLRAEFGADWFAAAVLKQPHCIIRE